MSQQIPARGPIFQPILDVLEYRPSNLELVPEAVIVEGKNDFYGLTFGLQSTVPAGNLTLIPGGGAGSLDPVIGLYMGWGRNFVVPLDSDSEGEKQRKRYLEELARR